MGATMIFEVVTSVNQSYYDKIGRDAIRTYLEHWSTHITVYAEQCAIQPNDRIVTIDFSQLDTEYFKYQSDPDMSNRSKIFAKKAFSTMHAMRHSTADWLIWLDADTLTKRKDPAKILADLLQPNYLAMYLGVTYTDGKNGERGHWLVPETGLFAVNLKHADIDRFQNEYRRRYVQRDFNDLRRNYDNDVFGAVIQTVSAEYLDLCANFVKPYKTPLKHTVFGEYLHHYKAKHSKVNYAAVQ
jgi:hypothetical protein